MKTDDVPRSMLVGLNQTKKAVRAGKVRKVLYAADAEEGLKQMITGLCMEYGVEAEAAQSMESLGTLCGIEVGCAVCAYLL